MNQSVKMNFEFSGDSDDVSVNYSYNFFPGSIYKSDYPWCAHEWFFDNTKLQEIFNCTAPNAIRNKELMMTIPKAYGIPFGLPAPKWLLEFGAIIIGTETELILKSRWVAPESLLDSGFTFQYETVGDAERIF